MSFGIDETVAGVDSETPREGKASSQDQADSTHLVNIRVTVPLPFFGRRYFVFLSGKEQRTPVRLKEERKRHPLLTYGNITFLALAGTLVGFAAIGALQAATVFVLQQTGALGGM